ncbi:hypothetical protein BC830DRAFT_392448 [Chytriomyces sp. MP71]|nr:hypothetical protein BC830DRAFT_392448 [Chytriomyces sp. MP71]
MLTESIAYHTSPDILLLFHGIGMLLAYAVLAPIAVLFARYVKYNLNGRVWFHAHASIVTFVFVAHLAAVSIAYYAVRDLHWTQPHVVAGIATTSLLFLQYPLGIAIAFCFRVNTFETPTLNQVHYVTGRILVLVAVLITIPLGLARFHSLYPAWENVWVGAVVYAVWIAVASSVFAFLEGWRLAAERLALAGGFNALLEEAEGSEGRGGDGDGMEVVEEFAEPLVFASTSAELEETAKKPTLGEGSQSASAPMVVGNAHIEG